jgi:predicted MFS family arabinose efflux permease
MLDAVRSRTPALLVAYGGLRMALFPIPVITLFWKDQIGMSLGDILLLQSIFALSAVLIEFPSGYLADRLGHRASLLIAAVLWVAGWVVYALSTTFGGIAVAEIALGAGMAFASGADSALLFTVLEARGQSGDYRRWEGRVRAGAHGSEALSSAFGGYAYAADPRLPFWMQVPAALLALASGLLMHQPVRRLQPPHRASHLAQAWWIVRHTLLHHARLRATVCLSVTLGLSTFVVVWLIQPYMQSRGIPAPWFGPLWALAHVYLAGVSLLAARAAERVGRTTVLFACCLLIAAGYGGLAAGETGFAAAFYLCFMTVRGLQGPLLVHALQNDAPEDARASVLSLNALLFRLSFAALGFPAGMFVDRAGMETALAGLGAAFAVAALAALAMFQRAHRS